MIDLGPAARRMAKLITDIDDSQLGAPTPCPASTVGDLIDHVSTFAVAFGAKASADGDGRGGPPPQPNAANLGSGWRERIGGELEALATAWRDPSSWEGMTTAGSIEMPRAVAGVVALDELLVHGWDLAVATGQPYDAADEEIQTCTEFVSSFDAPRDGGLFGPTVQVSDDARAFDRLLGLTGRDPGWTAGQ